VFSNLDNKHVDGVSIFDKTRSRKIKQSHLFQQLSHAVPNLWLNTKYNVQRLLEKHAVLSVDNVDALRR
jgi:hypothetical protein